MKTISLKKVAVVAVASLGFGLMSVVPANAATGTACAAWTKFEDSKITAMNLVQKSTNTNLTSTAVKVNLGATASNFTSLDESTTCSAQKFVGFLSDYPAGGFAAVTTEAAATPLTMVGANAVDATGGALTLRQTTSATGVTGSARPAISTSGLGTFLFTPTKVGTYVLKVFNDTGIGATFATLNNQPDATEFVQTISIVVTANAVYSNTLSTALMRTDNAATTPTTTTNAAQAFATSTKAITSSATINVLINNSSNAPMATGNTMNAEVSGPGYLKFFNAAVGTNQCDVAPAFGPAIGRSLIDLAIDDDSYIYLCADGSAGASTVKLTVVDIAGTSSVLATKSVTFFGAVTKIAATGVLTIGAAAGGALGVATAARTLGVTPSLIVKATDSAGNPVSGLNASFTLKSTDVTSMTETITCGEDIKATTNVSSSGGAGFYNCQTTASTGAKSGGKATLTVRIVDPADSTLFLTSTVDYTIGGSAATGTETLSFDKTSYAPGEAMVITRTAKDSAGNSVTDGTASPSISFSKAPGGTPPVAGAYVGGKSATSTSSATAGVFAPVTPGSFTATATAANGATITATATVTDANAGLMTQIDALNAKIVALNALIAKIMKKLGVK